MQIQNQKEIFRKLGFSKHADSVYSTVFEHGPLLAAHIAPLASIYRPALYKALFELLNADLLVRKKKGGRFLWSARRPNHILELFKSEIYKLEKAIPSSSDSEEIIDNSLKIFYGKDGIRAVFDDVINHTKKGETFYRYTSERDLDKVNSYLSSNYRMRRDKKRLERLVISNPLSGKQKRSRLERFIKCIPSEVSIFDQNIIQIMYGDRVAFIDLNTEKALVIENPALADFQKVIFRQLYDKLEFL